LTTLCQSGIRKWQRIGTRVWKERSRLRRDG